MPLAYSLDKVLNNQQVLPYFIHFLDSFGNIELIQFLMHLQGFYASYEDLKQKDIAALSKDATAIYNLFVDENGPKKIDFPTEIVNSTREAELLELFFNPKYNCTYAYHYLDYEKLPTVPQDIFKEAYSHVYNTLEFRDFPAFKTHNLFKKHEMEVLQNEPQFYDLIHIEVLLQELLELISSVEERSELQFILACDAFEDEFPKSSTEQAMEDAMGIYDRYISMQASSPLPISSSERLEIELSICQPSGTPDRKSFRPLHDRFCSRLEEVYLQKLKKSRAFQAYLEELTNLAEAWSPRSSLSEEVKSPRVRSDSINGKTPKAFPFSMERESMLGASTSKVNSLAQVDSLGRYKPMFDDRRWNSDCKNNKLKSKLTSYMNKKAAREEEEANEAAMAIIQDVHRMVTQKSFD